MEKLNVNFKNFSLHNSFMKRRFTILFMNICNFNKSMKTFIKLPYYKLKSRKTLLVSK